MSKETLSFVTPPPAEKLQNFFGVFLQFQIGVDTEFDRQDKDIQTIEAFLQEWQVVISKRLTTEDQSLAETSKVLRAEEFQELRQKNAIIHTGELAGKKLVDVLTADLMVNHAA